MCGVIHQSPRRLWLTTTAGVLAVRLAIAASAYAQPAPEQSAASRRTSTIAAESVAAPGIPAARVDPRASQLVDSLHARMLARVIAHELGHILLDSEDHAPRGLMRGRRPIDIPLTRHR